MSSYYPGNDIDLGTIVTTEESVTLSRQDRARHTYIVGASRTGKTKLLESICRQDLLSWPTSGCPVVVIDPHGTLYDGLMGYIAAEGLTEWPIVPLDLRRDDMIVSYNLLRHREGVDPAVICRGFVEAMLHAWGQDNTNATPRLATWLETLLMLAYEKECTLTEALIAISNPEIRALLAAGVENLVAKVTLESASHLTETAFQERIESTLYRINRFVTTQVLRATLCQTGESLDLGKVLAEGKILLACLSTEKTKVADEDAKALGSVLLTDLWTEAKRRGKREEGEVVPCYVHIDEFQNFISPTIAKGLSEASGFGLHLTLAHQYPSQLVDHGGEFGEMILNSVLANARNQIVFKVPHPKDLELLATMLYRQVIDPYKIKDEIWQMKVIGQEIKYLPSYNESTTDGMSHSEVQTHSETEGRSVAANWQKGHVENTANTRTTGHTQAETDSDGVSVGEARSDMETCGDSLQRGRNTSQARAEADSSNWAENQGHGSSFGNLSRQRALELKKLREGKLTSADELELEADADTISIQRSGSAGGGRTSTLARTAGVSEIEGHNKGYGTTDSTTNVTSHSHASQIAHSEGLGEMIGSADSRSDGGSDTSSYQAGESLAKGITASKTHATGTGLAPVVLSIFAKEVASRQFEPLAEQLHRAAQFIDGQPERHGIVRLASMTIPAQIITTTIEPPLTTLAFSTKWTGRILGKLPFSLTMIEARSRMDRRIAELRACLARDTVIEEPISAARKIATKSRPKLPSP